MNAIIWSPEKHNLYNNRESGGEFEKVQQPEMKNFQAPQCSISQQSPLTHPHPMSPLWFLFPLPRQTPQSILSSQTMLY